MRRRILRLSALVTFAVSCMACGGGAEETEPASTPTHHKSATEDQAARALARAQKNQRCQQGDLDACDPQTRAALEQHDAEGRKKHEEILAAEREKQEAAAKEAERRAAESRKQFEEKQAGEAACEVTPWCIGKSVCGTIAARTEVQKQMTAERANPSGVVDLGRLHDLGQAIQGFDAMLAQKKGAYATYAHQPFVDAQCTTGKAALPAATIMDACKRLEGVGIATACKPPTVQPSQGVNFVVAAVKGAGLIVQARDDTALPGLLSTFEAEKEAKTFVSTKTRIVVVILAADLPSETAAKVKAVVDAL